MSKEEIIEMIKAEEKLLWDALQTMELVFGKESEPYIRAQSRWSSVLTILTRIENENN